MQEHKEEVLKYHPRAIAYPPRFDAWLVETTPNPDADILGFGKTEEAAWKQAALNAARMS